VKFCSQVPPERPGREPGGRLRNCYASFRFYYLLHRPSPSFKKLFSCARWPGPHSGVCFPCTPFLLSPTPPLSKPFHYLLKKRPSLQVKGFVRTFCREPGYPVFLPPPVSFLHLFSEIPGCWRERGPFDRIVTPLHATSVINSFSCSPRWTPPDYLIFRDTRVVPPTFHPSSTERLRPLPFPDFAFESPSTSPTIFFLVLHFKWTRNSYIYIFLFLFCFLSLGSSGKFSWEKAETYFCSFFAPLGTERVARVGMALEIRSPFPPCRLFS